VREVIKLWLNSSKDATKKIKANEKAGQFLAIILTEDEKKALEAQKPRIAYSVQ
jgi:Trp operon repressor